MAGGAAAKLLSIGKWTLMTAAALVLVFVAVNAFDETLHPETAAYLRIEARQVPDERNGYFQMVGLSAQVADGAVHGAGMKYVGQIAEAQAKRIAGEAVRWPEFPGKPAPLPKLCGLEKSCLAEVAADEAAARRLLAEQRPLLARYRRLLEYPDYVETHAMEHPEVPLLPFTPLTAAQRLFFVDAALALRAGRVDAVLAELERSITHSRRMLAGSRTLVGKLVAAAHARKATQFTSELLASPSKRLARRAALLGRALQPLSQEERRIDRALQVEFRMQVTTLRSLDFDVAKNPLAFFLQRNATANRDYLTVYKPYAQLDAAPAEKFDAMRRSLREKDRSFAPWSLVYNPVGKILSATALPDWSGYTARMHDLDGLMRLVALQAAIVARRVPAAQIPRFVAASEDRYDDPYTAQPMRWDAARRQLYFEPRVARVIPGVDPAGRYGVTF